MDEETGDKVGINKMIGTQDPKELQNINQIETKVERNAKREHYRLTKLSCDVRSYKARLKYHLNSQNG